MKILAMTSVTLFSLLSLFMGAAAWFQSNRNVNNAADGMEISLNGNLASIDVYRATTTNVDGYTFSSTPIQEIIVESWNENGAVIKGREYGEEEWTAYSSCPAINMNPNITVAGEQVEDPFSPLSPYHPLMLVFTYKEELDASADKIRIYAETNRRFLAPSKSPSGASLAAETIQAEDNPMSSFIRTYSKGYDGETAVDFSYTRAQLSAMQSGSFATLDGENLPTFNDRPTFFEDNTHSVKKVAMIFEYNIDVIEYIYYYYVGWTLLDNTITALCDWRLYV